MQMSEIEVASTFIIVSQYQEEISVQNGCLSLIRRGARVPDIYKISRFLQNRLREKGLSEVTANDAAKWLDEAGLLKDSPTRPGKPLRDLLRAKQIIGQRQESNHRWFIDKRR
jgi:hypothetical protein